MPSPTTSQLSLGLPLGPSERASTTFTPNQKAPVHRWFRYSAGFSGRWAEQAIARELGQQPDAVVLDPFAGVGTTLVAAQLAGRRALGVEAHPLVCRIARAKLRWSSPAPPFQRAVDDILRQLSAAPPADVSGQPELLRRIFDDAVLSELLTLKLLLEARAAAGEDEAIGDLLWLCLLSILRSCSGAGTAPWQYVLPKKTKSRVRRPSEAFYAQAVMMAEDMALAPPRPAAARLLSGDARRLSGIDSESVDFVLTSPPYPNNYDYADATRIELTFLGEVERWRDLHQHTRRHLMVSCSQHARSDGLSIASTLSEPLLSPILGELRAVCGELTALRQTRKGKKHYDTMIAAYFRDIAQVLAQLRRVMRPGARACLVIGDSAPYGVYVPADVWMGALGAPLGLTVERFEQTRLRNTKWKNRKHRVPLKEGRLWLRRAV